MVSGNFAFLTTTLPSVYDDCRRAESYLTTDPRSACFNSRRAIEELVGHLYDVLALPPPYKDDLAVLTNDAGFENVTGNGINAKLNLIRKLGNTAVHQAQPIPAHAALSVLRELFHVTIWAAFRYSLHPGSVPTGAQFDPALAAKAAPLSREELVRLAQKFAAQDQAYAQALAEKDDLALRRRMPRSRRSSSRSATLSRSPPRSTSTTTPRPRPAPCSSTLLLHEAGWDLTEGRDREYEVTGMPSPSGQGFVDYVPWVPTGCRWRSWRPSAPGPVRATGSTRPSSTPTAWSSSSADDR